MAADAISALGGLVPPKFRNIFDEDVSLNLPFNDMSKWLTQIVPIGFLAAHTLMIFIDTNDKGHCFVPSSTDGKQLTSSQVQYITEFCVSQVTRYACFEDDGTLKDNCKSNNTCHHNTSSFDPMYTDNRSTLYLYRYYFFFLFLFSLFHVIAQKFWKLLFSDNIRLAFENIALLVEIRHAKKYGLASPNSQGATNSTEMENIDRHVAAIKYRVTNFKNTSMYSRLFRSISFAYAIRSLFGIYIDYQFLYIIFVIASGNLIESEVFVCDLHRDRSNIYLCDTLSQQFIPCTISFELETETTETVLLAITILDTLLQIFCWSYLLGKFFLIRRYNTDLQIDSNDAWSEYVLETARFLYPINDMNDLLIVKALHRQTNDKQDPLLKATVENMFDEIFILQKKDTEQSEQNPNGGMYEAETETSRLVGNERP